MWKWRAPNHRPKYLQVIHQATFTVWPPSFAPRTFSLLPQNWPYDPEAKPTLSHSTDQQG